MHLKIIPLAEVPLDMVMEENVRECSNLYNENIPSTFAFEICPIALALTLLFTSKGKFNYHTV